MSSLLNRAKTCRINRFGWGCAVATTLSLSLVACAVQPATAQTLTYKSSWLGNSDGTPVGHIMHNLDSLFVASDGKCYAATGWDEGGSNVLVFSPTDGSIICRPSESGTGSWGRSSNGVATGNGAYVYHSMKQGGGYGTGTNSYGGKQFPGTSAWQVIRRANLSDGSGAGFTKGNGVDGSYLVVSTGVNAKPVVGLAFNNNEIYAVDSNTNRIKVYNATTMSATVVRSWAITDPGKISIDSAGCIWMLQPTNKKLVRYSKTGVLQSQSITFGAAIKPRGFGIDPVLNRILVANDGVDQNILIYTGITTTPVANGTFGVTGGILAGTGPLIGTVGPLRFNRPMGVGVDNAGNTYVGCDGHAGGGGGTVIEKYDGSGNLLWNKIGLEFVDVADTAPSSEIDVYTKEEHFVMDYSKTIAGTEATYQGYTVNQFKYPNDPRGFNLGGLTSTTTVRELGGKRFLFVGNMYGAFPAIYRFNAATDGETAIPCGYFGSSESTTTWPAIRPAATSKWYWCDANGNGDFDSNEFTISPPADYGQWRVDNQGTIWCAAWSNNEIYKIPFGGLNATGSPIYNYSGFVTIPAPSIFTELNMIHYEDATDTMWLSGYTTTNPHTPDGFGRSAIVGKEIVRYDNWSTGNRTANLRIVLPYDTTASPGILSKCMTVCGGYVFAGELYSATIHVYDRTTGVKVGQLTPGSEIGSQVGWIDIVEGIRVTKRSNGEYLVFVEDDGYAKVVMYRWNPSDITPVPLTSGTIIGTAGTWSNGNTKEKAFDGDTGTSFDGPTADGCWVGRDLGAGIAKRLTKIRFYPRGENLAYRMNGGIFQGSNDGVSWTDVYTIVSNPAENAWTSVNITNTTSWRYMRYMSPTQSYGNVAELEFYGN